MLKRNKLSTFLSKSSEAPFGVSGGVVILATVATTLALVAFMGQQTEILREEFISVGFHNPKFFEDKRGIAGYDGELSYGKATSNYVTYELMRQTIFPTGALLIFVYIMINAWGEVTGIFGRGQTKSMFMKFIGMIILVMIFVPAWDLIAVEAEKFAITVLNPVYQHLPTDGTLPKESNTNPFDTPNIFGTAPSDGSIGPNMPTSVNIQTLIEKANEASAKTKKLLDDAEVVHETNGAIVQTFTDEDTGDVTRRVIDDALGVTITTVKDEDGNTLKTHRIDNDEITFTYYDDDGNLKEESITDKTTRKAIKITTVEGDKTIIRIPNEGGGETMTTTYADNERKKETITDGEGGKIITDTYDNGDIKRETHIDKDDKVTKRVTVAEDGSSKTVEFSIAPDHPYGNETVNVITTTLRDTGGNVIETTIAEKGVQGENSVVTTVKDGDGNIIDTDTLKSYPTDNCIEFDPKKSQILALVMEKNIQLYHQIRSDTWGYTGESPCDPTLRIAYVYDKAIHGATAESDEEKGLETIIADIQGYITSAVNTIFMGMTKTMLLFMLTLSGLIIMTVRELLLAVIISLLPMFVLLAFVPKVGSVFGSLLSAIVPLLLVPIITGAVFFTGAGILHDMELNEAEQCATISVTVNNNQMDICSKTGEFSKTASSAGNLTFWLASISLLILATSVPLIMVPMMGSIAQQATAMVGTAVLSGIMGAMSTMKGGAAGGMAGAQGAMASQQGLGSMKGIKSLLGGMGGGLGMGVGAGIMQDQQAGMGTMGANGGMFNDGAKTLTGSAGSGGFGGDPKQEAIVRGGGAKPTVDPDVPTDGKAGKSGTGGIGGTGGNNNNTGGNDSGTNTGKNQSGDSGFDNKVKVKADLENPNIKVDVDHKGNASKTSDK